MYSFWSVSYIVTCLERNVTSCQFNDSYIKCIPIPRFCCTTHHTRHVADWYGSLNQLPNISVYTDARL